MTGRTKGAPNVNGTGGAVTGNVVREAQFNATTRLLAVGAGAGEDNDDGITMVVEPRDNTSPGVYTITGRLVQTSGGPAQGAPAGA